MITLRLVLAAIGASLGFAGTAQAACTIDLRRHGSEVFSGRLGFKVFPGALEFRDVRRGDQPEPTFILSLDQPLCATGAEFSGSGDRISFDKVHLVPGGRDVAALQGKLRSLLGRHVEVRTNNLFEAHTGHHHAPIVAEFETVALDSEGVPFSEDPAASTVRGFYSALAVGDGLEASTFVVPEKRGGGPLSARSLSSFYGKLARPLRLGDVRPLGPGDFEATYDYRVGSRECQGRAVVSITLRNRLNLISSIRSLTGC